MSELLEGSLPGGTIGLIADAHVHPGKGPELPTAVLKRFAGVDCIVALGDMGETSGLDLLAAVAPVIGVRGMDDAPDDRRIAADARVLTLGNLHIGAVFDGARHGLLASNDPLETVDDLADRAAAKFGRSVGVLLCAASHKAWIASADGVLLVNPGSPTLAERRTVAILRVGARQIEAEVLEV